MRRSPPVRISRSGSGTPASARRSASCASPISDAGDAAGRRVRGQRAAGLDDVPAAAIGHGDDQPQSAIARRQLLRRLHAAREFGAQHGAVADEGQTHLVAVQVRHFAFQRIEKQVHEHAHFVGRAAPVLAAEGEQGEITHLALGAFLHDPAHHLDAGAMAGRARQAARPGPAAVAVHDDCDMLRRVGHLHTCSSSFSLSAMA